MQAIQTEYMGYLFRSRLEARWAVFFDLLGLDWQYEVEGFDLGEAGYYLPDFKVTSPAGAIFWYEVKPKGVTTDPKFEAFEALYEADWRRKTTERGATVRAWIDGGKEGPRPSFPESLPADYWYFQLLSGDPIDFLEAAQSLPGNPHDIVKGVGGVCPRCGHITRRYEYGFEWHGSPREWEYHIGCAPCDLTPATSRPYDGERGLLAVTSWHKGWLVIMQSDYTRHEANMLEKAKAARSARFEHGEFGLTV